MEYRVIPDELTARRALSAARDVLSRARATGETIDEEAPWLENLLTGGRRREAIDDLLDGVDRSIRGLETKLSAGSVADLSRETWVVINNAERSFKVLDDMLTDVYTGPGFFADLSTALSTVLNAAGEGVGQAARAAGKAAGSALLGVIWGLGIFGTAVVAGLIYLKAK